MRIRTAVILGFFPIAVMVFAGYQLGGTAIAEGSFRKAGQQLSKLRQLDDAVTLTILRLRYGAIKDDELPVTLAETIDKRVDELGESLEGAHHGLPPHVVAALGDFRDLNRRRMELLPTFLELNAELRESRRELPRVVVYIEREAEKLETGQPVARAVRHLDRMMRAFDRTPSEERYRNVIDAADQLDHAAAAHTPSLQKAVQAATAHTREVTAHRSPLDQSVEELLGLTTETSLDSLTTAHHYRYEELAARASRDGWLLLLACAWLFAHMTLTLTGLYRARRRAENANVNLGRERSFVNNVIDTMADALLVLRPDGTVRFVNSAAERMIGAPLEHIEGISIAHLLASDNAAQVAEDVREGRTFRDRVTGVEHCAGDIIPVSLSSEGFRNDDGEYDGFVVIAHDLRAMRQLHEKELTLAEERARTHEAELQAREMRAARDAAEVASQAKADFLANMSHEIRTPLNGVIGLTDLLMDTSLDADQRQYARTIASCGNSLLTLINDVLDLSKIEAGRLELEHEDFDLRATVEDTAWAQAPRAYEKGVELVALFRPGVPRRVRGDVTRLRQVITNLVGNAVKFTEQGEIVIELSVHSRSDDEIVLETAVHDTGIGILPKHRAAIFEKFKQADGSTTRMFGGTGLGLSISQKLVDAMGGEIRVESEFGAGSKFAFTAHFGVASESPSEPELPEAVGKDLRVLCVDRNARVLEALETELVDLGFRVDTAGDARSAVAQIDPFTEAGPLNLLILGRQGLEKDDVDALLQAASTEGVRVLLAEPHGADKGWDSKTGPRLLKPVARGALVQRIREVMGWARPERAPRVSQVARPVGQRGRFLVAEDNPVNQMVTRKMLEALGCRVDVVENGALAVQAVQERSYRAVFMDCQMPELDGFEATRRIRALEGKVAGIPIIALTANALKGDRERCLAAGMTSYVRKPVRHSDFDLALRELEASDPHEDDTAEIEPEAAPPAQAAAAAGSIYDTLNDGSLLELQAMDADGEAGIVPEIVNLFLQSTREVLAEIGSAVDEQDFDALRAAAHRLKGGSLNIGGMRLGNVAAAVEQSARDRDLRVASRLADHLVPEFERLESRLRARGFAPESAQPAS